VIGLTVVSSDLVGRQQRAQPMLKPRRTIPRVLSPLGAKAFRNDVTPQMETAVAEGARGVLGANVNARVRTDSGR
jgi:hypothetical protein